MKFHNKRDFSNKSKMKGIEKHSKGKIVLIKTLWKLYKKYKKLNKFTTLVFKPKVFMTEGKKDAPWNIKYFLYLMIE